MTSQSIKAKVSSKNLTRGFSDTATDGTVFTTNNLLDDNASQQLGILIPGVTIDNIQMTYTAGLAQWRIINSQNQMVSRWGFAGKTGYVCPMECNITPYQIKPTDLLQVFPKAVNATAGDTEILSWITCSGGVESFQATTAADNTLIAMTNSITTQSLGDWAFGKQLTRIQMQAEDGAFISEVQIIDQTGSVVWSTFGNTRLPTAGGKSTHMNLDIPCSIKIEKGFAIKVSTVTA
jgi:hypothetical protein